MLKLLYIYSVFRNHIISYPTPFNLNYIYSFGSLAGLFLSIQIISGILLAMNYISSVGLAFDSTIYIMNSVSYGYLLRFIHANGASFFFIAVYLHILRSLYYASYRSPRSLVWISGVFILMLMIVTAFLGYVLPFGQQSYYASVVITNLITVIPFIGNIILYWLLGGFSIGQATLNRFYSLHYLLPFILASLSVVHISILHSFGSTNPLRINSSMATIPFSMYFTSKDIVGVLLSMFFFGFIVFFIPNLFMHSDNLIPANPLVTPMHIVPEWYFLYLYAILRSIPSKAIGALIVLFFFIVISSLPAVDRVDHNE